LGVQWLCGVEGKILMGAVEMKNIQKTSILLAILAGMVIFNYISFQVTPRTVGQTIFPLQKKWNTCVNENVRNVSADKSGRIFVKISTALLAYDQNTGNLMWTNPVKDQRHSLPLKVVNEKVFVSDSDQLWAFDLKTGNILWKTSLESNDTWIPDASDKFVLLNSISDRIMAYDAKTGNKLWEAPGDRGYTQAFIDNDKVYVIYRGVQAYDAFSGKSLWKITNEDRETDLISAFNNGIVYYIEYPQDHTIDLVAYSTEKGYELWRRNFSDIRPLGLYTYNNSLYLTLYGDIYRLDLATGEIYWKVKFDKPKDVSFVGQSMYVLEPFYRIIHALDAESGKELGRLQIALVPFPLPYIDTQKMASTGNSLVFYKGCNIFVYGK